MNAVRAASAAAVLMSKGESSAWIGFGGEHVRQGQALEPRTVHVQDVLVRAPGLEQPDDIGDRDAPDARNPVVADDDRALCSDLGVCQPASEASWFIQPGHSPVTSSLTYVRCRGALARLSRDVATSAKSNGFPPKTCGTSDLFPS